MLKGDKQDACPTLSALNAMLKGDKQDACPTLSALNASITYNHLKG